MKTALQEAIEDIKEYRDSGNADVDTCNAILLKLASILEKEKETMCQFAKKWDKNLDAPNHIIRSAEDCFDETFTKDTSNRARLLDEMTKRNQELGLYDETFNTKEK